MDARTFIDRLTDQRFFQDQIVHVQALPEREAEFARIAKEAAALGKGRRRAAKKLERRVETLEAILDSDAPGWRKRQGEEDA